MKKLPFLILAFLPLSVFAGADTDRICADDSASGYIPQSIQVSYPGEAINVTDIWKTYTQKPLEMGVPELYYAVNIEGSGGAYMPFVKRGELYKYDCSKKRATLLLTTDIKKDGVYMRVAAINGRYIALQIGEPGMIESSLDQVILFDRKTNKKILQIGTVGTFPGYGKITGVVNGKTSYYIYFDDSSNDMHTDSVIYAINKKTKKITKL